MTDWDLELFVPGTPAPQGSKHSRPIYRGKGDAREFTGKVATVESSKSGVNAWRADVRAACLQAWADRPPLDGPIEVELEFIRKRPASAPKSYTPDASTQPDLSKLVRSTEDAITSAGVWRDDALVIGTTSSKRCAEIGETPGAHIRIRLLQTARERAHLARSGSPRAPESADIAVLSDATPFPGSPHQGGPVRGSVAPPVGSNALFCPEPTPQPDMEGAR